MKKHRERNKYKIKGKRIPDELKEKNNWILWREEKNEEGKPTKRPYGPWKHNGDYKYIDATNPEKNGVSFKEAKKWKKEDYGLGFCFSENNPYVGVDIDHIEKDNKNKIKDWIAETINEAESYTEISPSGTGCHIIVKGSLDNSFKNTERGIEVYGKKRYFTMTGWVLKNLTEIKTNQEFLDKIKEKYGRETEKELENEINEEKTIRNKYGWKFGKIIEKDDKLKKLTNKKNLQAGYPSISEADFAFVQKCLFWEFDKNTIPNLLGMYRPREKTIDRDDYAKTTVENAVKERKKESDEDKNQTITKLLEEKNIDPKKWDPLKGGGKKEKKDEENIEAPSIVTDTFLAETVKDGGVPRFGVWNKGELKYKSEIEYAGEKYIPLWDETAEKGAIKLPEKAEEYEDTDTLIEEIKTFIKKWVDFSDKFLELSAWYVLLTWVHDKVSTIPYLRFLGDFGTGKTRAVKTIGGLCYKAIDTAGATTAAAIERMVERWGGSLMMNEADFSQSETDSNIVKILNEGFESTGCIIKAHKEKQDEVVVTNPYSPKILATRRKWDDQALESRCLTEVMNETEREDILPIVTDEFYEEQQKLRNKLLMYRFKNYRKIDENEVKDIWNKIKTQGLDRRLIQATINFSILFWHNKDMFERFNNFLKSYQEELKSERANTHEGRVADCVNRILKNDDVLSPSNIAEMMEEEHNYDDVAPSSVGKWLRRLGLSTKVKRVDGGTKRTVKNDIGQIIRILRRYIPKEVNIYSPGGTLEDYSGDSVTGVTNVTGVTGTPTNNNTRDNNEEGKKESDEGGSRVPVTGETSVTPVTEIKNKLLDLLNEEQPKTEELPLHFDECDLEAVGNVLMKWKEDGRVFKDGSGRWCLNER